MRSVSIHVVHPYSSIDIVIAWKKSHLILSDRSDFHMINNLSIAVYVFGSNILSAESDVHICLAMCVNWTTNFRGLPLKEEMAPPSHLRHMNSVLFVFM